MYARELFRKLGIVFGVGVVVVFGAAPAQAAFPERPITIVVPFPRDGGNDVLARSIAPLIQEKLGPGAEVNVVNMAGATGEVGWSYLANSPADGYTLGMIVDPGILTLPIERDVRFSINSFDPLACLVRDPSIWAVRDDSPFHSLEDVVAYARAAPNSLTIATTGIGSDDHLSILRMQKLAGVRFVHVPFEGGARSRAALTARAVSLIAFNLSEALSEREADHIRILGIMTEERSPLASGVATFAEQGFAIRMAAARGIAAPLGLSADVRQRLVGAVGEAAADPRFRAFADRHYQTLDIRSPAAFAQEIHSASAVYRSLWWDMPWVK